MKQIRLLPVVIVAACALLLLKGVGIMTNGGYVLVGSSTAVAAGGGASNGDAPLTAEDALLTVPDQPTMTDTSPLLDDAAPTLPLGPAAEAHGGEAARVFKANFPDGYLGTSSTTDPTSDPGFFSSSVDAQGGVNTVRVRAKDQRPLPARPAGEGVLLLMTTLVRSLDPCRLAGR